ncbi:FG-GAP repeat domain-containing protein [Streptomyces katsurahamanus]|uniref:VCBS repeat-containing protein n=1 Tax=Streptomyces katsurahamanus TaxID=2577098 RepID=A0ABW9NPQ9_9ACTN|nr:FG-GAP and VCBS repeat-containing protein [Streptomyces katsurahamanus]MQS35295.1 VCBS repeat-containing protein [Streptomyces katsurahamanus]
MRTSIRTALATAVTVSLTGGLLGLTTGTATAAVPAKPAQAYDFNGDGNRDYVTGEFIDEVVVTYGTATGPGARTFTFDQDSPGIPGDRPEPDEFDEPDEFGRGVASADFDGDGYADLAVSDPDEHIGAQDHRGMVMIVWGARSGLGSKASTIDPASSVRNQKFGWDLATGDFNGDGKPDLAVADRWSVHVHRGGFTPSGTSGKVSTFAPPEDSPFPRPMLAAGKVTKDRITDLYVLGEGRGNGRHTLGVWFLKGGSTIKPGKPTTAAKSNTNHYPDSAVVADFDKDGYGDLAYNDPGHKSIAGAVHVLRGGKNGPADSRRITQDTPGVATAATADDFFGISISAGDTDRDGYPDLAIGTAETIGELGAAGGAHLLHGGKKGLTGSGSKWFTRDTKGIPGKARESAWFGRGVRLHDFDRDGDADLLISGREKTDRPGGTLLSGGRSGITTAKVREVPLPATYEQ